MIITLLLEKVFFYRAVAEPESFVTKLLKYLIGATINPVAEYDNILCTRHCFAESLKLITLPIAQKAHCFILFCFHLQNIETFKMINVHLQTVFHAVSNYIFNTLPFIYLYALKLV